MKKRKPLQITGEKVVSRKDPTKVLGDKPEDFPGLVDRCKAATATIETGQEHEPDKAS